MRSIMLVLVFLLLIPILGSAAPKEQLKIPHLYPVNVDDMNADLDLHHDKGKKHHDDPGNPANPADPSLSKSLADSVLWYSQYKFSIIKLEQLNTPLADPEPFQRDLTNAVSDSAGGLNVIYSLPAKPGLTLTGKVKVANEGMVPGNYYKLTFKYLSGPEKNKSIDPHIIIHQ